MTKGRSYINSYADRIMRENMIEEVGTLPVSYTHLDVYKRQALCNLRVLVLLLSVP